MAIGMACGTRFYLLAVAATIVIGFLWWALSTMNLFAKDIREQVLKVRLPADMRYDTLFERTFSRHLASFSLIAVETVQAGTLTELVYGVVLKGQADAQEFLMEMRRLTDNNKVALITGFHEVDL
jgi:hypothetical protein